MGTFIKIGHRALYEASDTISDTFQKLVLADIFDGKIFAGIKRRSEATTYLGVCMCQWGVLR